MTLILIPRRMHESMSPTNFVNSSSVTVSLIERAFYDELTRLHPLRYFLIYAGILRTVVFALLICFSLNYGRTTHHTRSPVRNGLSSRPPKTGTGDMQTDIFSPQLHKLRKRCVADSSSPGLPACLCGDSTFVYSPNTLNMTSRSMSNLTNDSVEANSSQL